MREVKLRLVHTHRQGDPDVRFQSGATLSVVQKSYAGYLQDDWKILRNLALNQGVRYDYATPWSERYSRLAYFDTSRPDPVTRLPGSLQFLNAGAPDDTQILPNRPNFAPRLGFAWTVNSNTVIRGGGGIFYFPGNGAISAAPTALGEGYYVSNSVYLGPPAGPPNTPPVGASLANPFASGLVTLPSTCWEATFPRGFTPRLRR